MKQEKNTAIVLAAGQGKRMNSRIQKQFLEIDHRPVLYYSLECFQKSPLIQDIILVTGEEMISSPVFYSSSGASSIFLKAFMATL